MARPAPTAGTDERRLGELGYRQQLQRQLTGGQNLAVTFAVVAVLSGCLTSYRLGMQNGGPAAITLGWLVVGLGTVLVAAALAEVASVLPTTGGLYWWSYALAGRAKAGWSWATGLLNLVGLIGLAAAVNYGAARNLMALLEFGLQVPARPAVTLGIFLLLMAGHAWFNRFGVRALSRAGVAAAGGQVLAVVAVVVLLVLLAPGRANVAEVFTATHNSTGLTGTFGAAYAIAVGLVLAQYSLTGFDTAAHLAEETRQPSRSVPRAMVLSTVVAVGVGFVFLVAVTASIQDYDRALQTASRLPPAQILVDALGTRTGLLLLALTALVQLICGACVLASAARLTFALSRDGALPAARIWRQVSDTTGAPASATYLCAALSGAIMLPVLWNRNAYLAASAIATIALTVTYLIPLWLRRRNADFRVGDWRLGRWSAPIGWAAVLWSLLSMLLLLLPPAYPITLRDFDYAPVVLLVGTLAAWIWWRASVRRHFRGPQDVRRLSAAEQPERVGVHRASVPPSPSGPRHRREPPARDPAR